LPFGQQQFEQAGLCGVADFRLVMRTQLVQGVLVVDAFNGELTQFGFRLLLDKRQELLGRDQISHRLAANIRVIVLPFGFQKVLKKGHRADPFNLSLGI
jgi:hypothetical protein